MNQSPWPPYPKYKDSGVEWLGKVPEHWEVKKIRNISTSLDHKRIPLNAEQRAEKQGNIPYWGANSIVDYINELIFDETLVLLGEDGAPFFEKDKPVAFLSIGPIWPNNHIHVLRINSTADPGFVKYSLNSVDYSNFVDGSTRDKLTQSKMNNIQLSFPPLSEQLAIVSFLDQETSRIDALISEKERLISLLQEYRQTLISHTVIKGLDPNVKMKDSGVEWLGEVPEHWEILRLKRVLESLEYGISESLSTDGEIPILRMSNIYDGKIFWDDLKFVDSVEDSLYLQNGDLLFNRTNSLDLVGKVGLFEENRTFKTVSFASYLVRLRPNNRANSKYLDYLLNIPSFLSEARSNAIPSIGQANLNPTRYSHLLVAVPPLEEQQNINDLLDQETSRIDTLISESRTFIDLLKEYRSSLITAAVTGKIDVRGFTPLGSEKKTTDE
ncbi:restriction endonuclease subunit S [Leptospirillum ferriphilum]|uniref:Type I restriction modification DNA specificity domain-containing protein n=1 Tax=Leptospirillum ferriphilum TaxID=178606 RepID=A0A1V3SUR8_9BACT|nr:restriction endonuclease subunit S [Leptospirillum ferriphilum]OOH72421.1 hypothetical protein BOX24_06885 [Leptospirillum ferriphilum]